MTGLTSLLGLMQVSDSLFPSGAFAHSYGLEQLAREVLVRTPDEVERWVGSVLCLSLAPGDAVAALRAHRAVRAGDVASVIDADRALLRTKPTAELRGASLSTGRRFLEETSAHIRGAVLDEYAARLREDKTLGLHPVVFAALAATLEVEAEETLAALLMTAVTALLQASMRLLPVSHRDVQGALHRLRPVIASLATEVVAQGEAPLRSFAPLQEIASMRHAGATARLFAS
jgi:urease accessory protein